MKKSKKIGLGILIPGVVLFLGFDFLALRSVEPSTDAEPELVPFTLVEVDRNGPQDIWAKAAADMNNDGLKDLIVGGNAEDTGGLVWYENPAWIRHGIDTESRFGTDVELADINGNGSLDAIAILADQKLAWYESPDWTQHLIGKGRLHDIEVADFDGDGQIEIVGRNQGEFGQSGAKLFFYKRQASGSWDQLSFAIPEGEGLVASDLNGDDRLDIIVNETWYENTGTFLDEAAWREHVYTDSWTHKNSFVDVGDINGNGRPDIVLSPSELAEEYYRISWLEAPADPTSGPWTEHVIDDYVEAVYHFIGLADFNQNGRLDVATAEMEQGEDPDEVKLYLNPGNGNSWTKQVLYTGGSHSMEIMDINNNGVPDLFGANWRGKEVLLWVNLKR
ncbi:MAG: VCBS repeat-containing protein [Balneolales bacterium]